MQLVYYHGAGGRTFRIIHGHQADAYCGSDDPGLGRITAIYSGLLEDLNGGPMLSGHNTVEQRAIGPLDRLASLWNRLRGKPDRYTEINRKLLGLRDTLFREDVIVCGHTHKPGRIGDWHLNWGTWAERTNSFVRINSDGTAGVFYWVDCRPVLNTTELPI
jgi:hypothetical protein